MKYPSRILALLLPALLLLTLASCQTESRAVANRNGKQFSRNLPAGAMYGDGGAPMRNDFSGLSHFKNTSTPHGYTSLPGSNFRASSPTAGYSPRMSP